MGFFHFWDQRAFQKFLHFIEDISGFLNPDCSYTIENDHPKTIREKILLKVVLLSFQSSFLQYFIHKISIWKRILLNVIDPLRVNPEPSARAARLSPAKSLAEDESLTFGSASSPSLKPSRAKSRDGRGESKG
jgi:hypothetical protein